MLRNRALVIACAFCAAAPLYQATAQTNYVQKLGHDMDVRSGSRIIADELTSGKVILPELAGPVGGIPVVPQIQLRGGNVQASDPSLDYTQIFTGYRPFVRATQSEVSVVTSGKNIVAGYNNSAGIHVAPNPGGPGLIVDQVLLSGYAYSSDGGRTWTSGYLPGAETDGDPSLGVDRRGVVYYASLGTDKDFNYGIIVNRSNNGGASWSDAALIQHDDGADKEWLAVGPDPVKKSRDNVYVTWTSFQENACELRFGRSTDGGQTWTAKTIFVPTANADPTFPTNCLQFSNPTVDQITGTLYVPFLRFSNADQDFIQVLISDDAGETFHFATFNIPGAPDPTVMPITQPGHFTECSATRVSPTLFSVNLRLTIHDATLAAGPSLTGLPRFLNASRLTVQPATAARNGVVYMAWNNSTSPFFADPNSNSNILFIRSSDGGKTWSAPVMVNPAVSSDTQHVLPSLAIDVDPNDVHVTYYTQHANGTVDLDLANSHDGGASFPPARTVRVTSQSFNLPPTNVAIPSASNPFATTNYDRQIQQCYALGEYQGVTTANGTVYTAWGDSRNLLTEPVNALSPLSGQTHPEQDVFFQVVKAQ